MRWPDTHGPATAIPRFARIPSRLMAKAIKGGETEGRVEITLENVGAGHSVPSGWPGRQLALVLVLRNAAEDSLAGLQHEVTIGNPLGPLKARVIQRSFGITMPGDGRFEGRLYSRVDPSEPRALMTSRTWPVAKPEIDMGIEGLDAMDD